jgi:hypothetical protein
MPARTDIKAQIVIVLKAASSIASTRVYQGRDNVLPDATTSFPVVYVYMLREDVQTLTLAPSGRHQTRTLMLAVDYLAKAATPEALEAAFDTACGLIEAAISADTTLAGTCKDIILTSTEYLYEGDEEQPAGRAALGYTVTYFAREP